MAVAANFATTLAHLKSTFESQSRHQISVIIGSTGKLYAQIQNGAPFDIFLAADSARPLRVEESDKAIRGSRFTYAQGRLVLWAPGSEQSGEDCLTTLKTGDFKYLAIANPLTAPYGQAARQTLEKLALWKTLQPKVVQGENIGQTFQFLFSGNAQLGFLALSQALDGRGGTGRCRWDIPRNYHDPLNQQAVLLMRGRDNPAAQAFYQFLRGERARSIIAQSGYDLIPLAEKTEDRSHTTRAE